jgi:hypothetical protein
MGCLNNRYTFYWIYHNGYRKLSNDNINDNTNDKTPEIIRRLKEQSVLDGNFITQTMRTDTEISQKLRVQEQGW